jgi:hypothetical protein
MGIGSAVTSGFGHNPDRASLVNPLFRSEREAVQPGLFFNPVEFDGIKTGVVELLLSYQATKFPLSYTHYPYALHTTTHSRYNSEHLAAAIRLS